MGKYLELAKRAVPPPVRDTRETETEGTARPFGPFPEKVADLVRLWVTWPAPRGRWPRGERGPMMPRGT